ncbi:pentatricopeptide repeat-containing protein [Cocos nucifera]|uniref:Pentatricopeptide repeat-containing protein n=1 Tax=Cocos nucifera TaxID=13894 RepID=A0A8K0IIX7_COCNU|nr:pentatricopeptide repeat-containing protein [Cocos nucifera]
MASASGPFYYSCEGPLALVASSLLQRCTSPDTLRKARQLHALILIAIPPTSPPFLRNNLLSIYSKCSSLGDAQKIFDTMPTRNLVSYNAMISAYSKAPCHTYSALHLFQKMDFEGLKPNASTLSSLVQASSSLQDPWTGAAMHSRVVSCGFSNNMCVQTALLGMYSNFGSVEAAGRVFGEMGERDVIAWNSIILSNVKNGSIERGLQLFSSMLETGLVPNNSTFTIVLNACGRTGDQIRGRIIHAQMIKFEFLPDVPSQNALLDMYASCGDMMTALSVFERIEIPDLVSWNSLIAGYSDVSDGEKAIKLFAQLKKMSLYGGPNPDEYTFAAVVSATASLPSIYYGKPLHSQTIKVGLEYHIFVGNTLISMYFMNGEPDSSQKLFNYIPEKDVIIWTEMIVGHSRLGEGELAIKYFYHMLEEGHKVDSFSLSSALNSSADLAALRQGEIIHSMVVKAGYESNMCVCGSLVDMYAKNGNLESANSVFYRIPKPDLKCWNSMIGGYGNHGNAEQVFKLFNEMVRRGLEPDHVTYVSLLSACSHCGLVEKGRFYWFCMLSDGIMPGLKHYTCMVSLLSRAGLLQEAEELIMRSPFINKSPELWRILLSSCIFFRNLALGVHAAEQVLILEPADYSTHILLSNLYASVGRWDAMAEMRKKIRGLMLEKEPGLSWIEIKNMVHAFSADDDSHVHVDDCRNELLRLQRNLKRWETSELYLLCSV